MLSFQEALMRATELHKKRHLLLGNGFSIAARPKSFRYGRLLEEADLTALSVPGADLFASEGTSDFEAVIRALRTTSRMIDFYKTRDRNLTKRLADDAERLKEVLATTLASKHPDYVGAISDEEYRAARNFLSNFERFFTVNYDLLLYWTLLQDLEPRLRHDDGFRADHDDPDAPWVAWNDYNQYGQNVYFVHGGLHLYADGATLRKLTFKRTDVPLMDQIRAQLDDGVFPLIVTEGTSEEKHAAILHHGYLAKSLRAITSCEGSLFIHGHSLDPNDWHVLRGVVEGKFKAIFVSLHGKVDSKANNAIRSAAETLAAARPEKKPLLVEFYDAESAAVWG
jgi:Domain of unknown function (DUF4917)